MKKRREPGIYRPLPGPGPLGPPPSSPIDFHKSYVHSRPAPSTGAPASRNTSTEEFWVVGRTYALELTNSTRTHVFGTLDLIEENGLVFYDWTSYEHKKKIKETLVSGSAIFIPHASILMVEGDLGSELKEVRSMNEVVKIEKDQ